MKAIVTYLQKLRPILLLLGALTLILILGSSTVKADLGGSRVVFAPESDGAACYIPDYSFPQTLCFEAITVSSDGEDVEVSFWKFPSDLTVSNPTIESGSASCEKGEFSGGIGLTSMGLSSGEYYVTHSRLHEPEGTCTAIYCFTISTGATTTENALVSWVWSGKDYGSEIGEPHRPCSSDGYKGPLDSCDVSTDPPATVPVCEHVNLNILPKLLPPGEVNVWYEQQLSVEDGTGPFSWWMSASSLPGSLGLHTDGLLQGDPGEEPGTFNFTAYVRGPGWSDGSLEYSLTIHPALSFSPDTLPAARLNTAYYQEVSVNGRADETPVLTHESGILPTGITFSGTAFTGTPTEEGTFADIVIKATYTDGLVKTKTYTLNVWGEHLFTWEPQEPDEKSYVTFTAIDGFGYGNYHWSKSYSPGEHCNQSLYNYTQIVDIYFHESGQYQVCLGIYDYGTDSYLAQDSQWVTVKNLEPDIWGMGISPSPSLVGQAVSGWVEYDRGPTPFTCQVDWGDGTDKQGFACQNGYANLPEYTYAKAGTYTVQVWVTDGEGLTGTTSLDHDVVYLFAVPPNDIYLASSSDPTTIRLEGKAAVGYEDNLNFYISELPEFGTILQPVIYATCVFDIDEGIYECWADVVYSPEAGEPGYLDSFTFVLEYLDKSSNQANVRLWVDENTAPTALAGSADVSAVNPTIIALWATDPDVYEVPISEWDTININDRMTFIIDSGPSYGTLTEAGWTDCDWVWDEYERYLSCYSLFEYTPVEDTTATTDSFTFYVNDSHYDSAHVTFDLTLHAPKTLVVNTTDDVVDESGCDVTHCSLREAVGAAFMGDTIEFDLPLPTKISLIGNILINKDLTIVGPGADQLAISGSDYELEEEFYPEYDGGVFKLEAPWTGSGYHPIHVDISGLTIIGGRAWAGGGIYNSHHSTLVLSDSVIGPNNVVTEAGGGLANVGGNMTLNRCTVVGNHGTGSWGGAGIFAYREGVTTLINSTVTDNVTNNYGGGILVAYKATVNLIHSTISGNTANQDYADYEWGGGGGIYIVEDDLPYQTGGTVIIHNSIVAGNTDMTDPATAGHEKWHDVYGHAISLGGNLIGDGTGSSGWVASDQVGSAGDVIDPLLDPLALNAPGSTPTFALLSGSPAIDAVACAEGITEDQRGVVRPQDGNGDGVSKCDIGAFELEYQEILDESQLTSARTKCAVYAAGDAPELLKLHYTISIDKKTGAASIKSIAPSTFLYYVTAVLPAEHSTLLITQENHESFPAMGASVTLFDENCARLSPQLATVTIDDGNVTINFVAGVADRIIYAAVNYTARSLRSQTVHPIMENETIVGYPDIDYFFNAALNGSSFTDAELYLEWKP